MDHLLETHIIDPPMWLKKTLSLICNEPLIDFMLWNICMHLQELLGE